MEFSFSGIIDFLRDYHYGLPVFILFGAVFGSFATMASYRIPRDEDWVFKPSSCPLCNHRLGFLDLFPILSWLLNFGKCHYCKVKISIRYPLTELAMATLFAIIYLKFGVSLVALSMLGLAICLVIMIVTDLEHRIIPDEVQIAILAFGVLYNYSIDSDIYRYFSGSLFGLSFALALRYGFFLWKKREGLGMGDVKFFATSGMFLGVKLFIPFLFFSGVFGVIFSFFWKKLFKEDEFPFGPCLAISMLFCLIFPEHVVRIFYYYE